jgi:hypothetical protein
MKRNNMSTGYLVACQLSQNTEGGKKSWGTKRKKEMQNTPNCHKSEDFNQGHTSVAPLTTIYRPTTSGSTGSKRHLGENAKFVTLGESGAMLGSLTSLLAGLSLKEKNIV